MAEQQNAVKSTETSLEEGSLLDQILAETRIAKEDESFKITEDGVKSFLKYLLAPLHKGERIDKAAVDAMIAELDASMSKQVNEILHAPEVQQLESAWRGLKYLVQQVDFRENTKVEILSVTKQELVDDFEDTPELVKSGLYKTTYSSEFGQFGGNPYGLLVANFDVGPGPQDIQLLRNCAAVSAMAHAPFITNASPAFFGLDSFEGLARLSDLEATFQGPQYARWRSFRESEDARNVGLCLPRFLLRLPYGQKTVPVKSFNFEEETVGDHDAYLWGHSSIAFATRVADSFAKYRWCANIIGPQAGGTVENLPLHQFEAMGAIETKIPTETLIAERREYELAEEGFIGLVQRKGADNACFFSANSAQKPKLYGNTPEGKTAETNYRLGTQLPYMFIVNRLAHYIKVLQREQISSNMERGDLERNLNHWISQYVSEQENPAASVRAKRPLRFAQVTVEDVDGQPGWYKCGLKVRPHFKYMGASFTLSLVGKLEKTP